MVHQRNTNVYFLLHLNRLDMVRYIEVMTAEVAMIEPATYFDKTPWEAKRFGERRAAIVLDPGDLTNSPGMLKTPNVIKLEPPSHSTESKV